MELISLEEARKLGLRRYFNGIPCPKGHIGVRLVARQNCEDCSKEQSAAWSKRNRELLARRARDWVNESPERRKRKCEKTREWRQRNKEHLAAYERQRALKNPERKRAVESKRRAQKNAAGGSHTGAQIKELLIKQGYRCANVPNCGISIKSKFEADHIMPLCKGGTNDIKNIQLLCPSCNARKQAKDPIKWAQELGRLI